MDMSKNEGMAMSIAMGLVIIIIMMMWDECMDLDSREMKMGGYRRVHKEGSHRWI